MDADLRKMHRQMEDRPSRPFDGADAGGTYESNNPPWENRAMSQVPYLGRSLTPPMSHAEQTSRQWPQSDLAGRRPGTKPKLLATNSAPPRSEYSSPVSQEARQAHWNRRRHTSALQPPALAPYETPLDLPADTRASSRPFATVAHPPPSPPRSTSFSSTRSDTPPPQSPAKALPGTMSSRASRFQGNARSWSKEASHSPSTRSEPEHKPISKRLSSAFRGMFKKEPVDESELERISDRHWTEEY